MWRFVVVMVCGGIGAANADATLPGGATVVLDPLLLHENGNPMLAPAVAPTPYFNLAHCFCSQPGAAGADFVEKTFAYQLTVENETTPVDRPLEIWVGTGCDDAATRAAQCHRIESAGIADIATIPAAGVAPEVGIYDLMVPEPTADVCPSRAVTASEWAIADGNGDGVYDYFASAPIATDSLPPPLPTNFSATGSDQAIDISWTPPADLSDVDSYQVLCADQGGNPVATQQPPAARYMTGRLLCQTLLDVPLHPSMIDTGASAIDANDDVEIPQGIAQLDPTFICGQQLDPTASTVHLAGLPNDQPMLVMLLAIDKAGNASATYFMPTLTTNANAHTAGGGSCLIAETFGDDHRLTRQLRAFRDETLASTAIGRAMIDGYYATLARLGSVVHGSWPLRVLAGVLLLPLVAFVVAWQALSLPGLLALLLVIRILARFYNSNTSTRPARRAET